MIMRSRSLLAVQDGIQPHECLYDLTERGSFTHVFTNSGLDLQDPIAIRFGSERKWRFTHVECLIDVPFRFPQGIDIIWVKWGLRDLVALEAYASTHFCMMLFTSCLCYHCRRGRH